VKKTTKKLVLGRDTVRALAADRLSVVAGGNKIATASGCVTECSPTRPSAICSADHCTDYC